jgi:two-component system CheB/CheR fusion protein
MVTFATQNVIMHPPFTKLDILICRNLLIYLTPELQKKLMPLFHFSLNPDGILFLGSAESIGTSTDLFSPLYAKSRLFRRNELVKQAQPLSIPTSFVLAPRGASKELPMLQPAANLQSLTDQLLLQHYSPPAVLTNDKGDILYISARTGRYLEPAIGKANLNVFAMAREGLQFALGSAFQKALRQKEAVDVKGIKIGTNGGTQLVDITVQQVAEPEALQGMVIIVFRDVATSPKRKRRTSSSTVPADTATVLELEQEIQGLREELQTTREEMQSSHEELTSTNEELQSANEELQSTNEELTTSREEMQSINEELQSVNAEQQSKMEELNWSNNDMINLLNSTEIITVFLDNQLRIRRFTIGADKLFKLIPSDVGRPLSDIVSDLNYSELSMEAGEVLRTLVFSEKQITTTDGRWYSVRIMPYRTTEDVIGGVVITFSNITAVKALEAELRKKISQLEAKS